MVTDDFKSLLRDYQKAASRTASKTLGMRIIYLGLVGEVGELADHVKKHLDHGHDLDVDYVKKEVGDICWYLSQGLRIAQSELDHFCPQFLATPIRFQDLFHLTMSVADSCYAVAHTGLRKYDAETFRECFRDLTDFITYVELSWEDVLNTNIEKLKRRYPEGFSFEASRNRSE